MSTAKKNKFKVITFNMDFGLGNAAWQHDLNQAMDVADAICVQEAKNANLEAMARPGWVVYQNRKDTMHAGTALLWRKDRARALNKGQTLLVDPGAIDRIQKRYITWADLEVDGEDVITIAAVHMPPIEVRKELYGPAAQNVVDFVHAHQKHPLLIGADWNWQVSQNPDRLATRTNMVFRGVSIDGFLIDKALDVNDTWSTDYHVEHHKAFGVELGVKAPGKQSPPPPKIAGLVMVTSNLKNANTPAQVKEDAQWIADNFKPTLWACQEATNFIAQLKSIAGYNVALTANATNAMKSVPILYDPKVLRLVGVESTRTASSRYITIGHFQHRTSGESIYFFNTQVIRTDDHVGEQLQYMAELVSEKAAGANKVFWAGDFNTDADKANIKQFLDKGLLSVYQELGTPDSFDTFGSQKSDILGKHIQDARIKATTVHRSPKLNSDHRFVAAGYDMTYDGGNQPDPTEPPPLPPGGIPGDNPDPGDVGTPTDPGPTPTPSDPPPPAEKDLGSTQDHTDCCGGRVA